MLLPPSWASKKELLGRLLRNINSFAPYGANISLDMIDILNSCSFLRDVSSRRLNQALTLIEYGFLLENCLKE